MGLTSDCQMSRESLSAFLFAVCLATTAAATCQAQVANEISEAQKKQFVELLKTLPFKGEFFTEDAVKTAGPYLPVLFALTDKDIEGYDLYPFVAISRGLFEVREHRLYANNHFADIRHSELKLFWAAMLFKYGKPSSQIVQYLKLALKSDTQARQLAEMAGPHYEDLKRRIEAAGKH
jgi:hypothetical protein